MSAPLDNRRAAAAHIETASERRINRQLEQAEPAYGWLPLAPEINETSMSRRAIIAAAFGDEQSFGFLGHVVEFTVIVAIVALVIVIVMHQTPFLVSGWACVVNAVC